MPHSGVCPLHRHPDFACLMIKKPLEGSGISVIQAMVVLVKIGIHQEAVCLGLHLSRKGSDITLAHFRAQMTEDSERKNKIDRGVRDIAQFEVLGHKIRDPLVPPDIIPEVSMLGWRHVHRIKPRTMARKDGS